MNRIRLFRVDSIRDITGEALPPMRYVAAHIGKGMVAPCTFILHTSHGVIVAFANNEDQARALVHQWIGTVPLQVAA